MPTSCEVCLKPMWHMLKPPPALGCKGKWFGFFYFLSIDIVTQ